MKKLLEFLNGNIDKVAHALVCMNIVVSLSLFVPLAVAVAVAMVVALLKEFIDHKRYGGWDNKDILADVIGIVAGIVVVFLGMLV